MKKKKYTDDQILQSRVITVLFLQDKVSDKDFVTKLVNCFKKDQTTTSLISNVNRTFSKDDSKSGGVKAVRANKDVPFEQASHPAENKEPEKPAANKKSDKKDDSKSGSGNKRVIEQQKTQKPHTRPMQPRIHRNGGEQK